MTDKEYTASSIKVLKGLEAVRKRPGMYIGDTEDGSGLHHMVYEVVDNAIDEVMAGHCATIEVRINSDESVTITDDGRGIPTDWHEDEKMSAAKVIMTQLHAGGKFDHSSYKISGGLHGVGVSVVNALSKKLQLRIWRDGKEHFMEFDSGLAVDDLQIVSDATDRHGTEVTFWADPNIFSQVKFDFKTLHDRLRDLAFLNPQATIVLQDLRSGKEKKEVMEYKGGVKSFVSYLDNKADGLIMDEPVSFCGERDQVKINCSLQWNGGYSENILCFTNNVQQRDGGTHLSGLKTGLTRCVSNYMQNFMNNKSSQQEVNITGEDVREGMTCVLSILVPDPKFSSQTKDKLVSSEVRVAVEGFIYDELSNWLAEYPKHAKNIVQRIVQAAHSREAARKARELSRKKSLLDVAYLPGKLSDCQTKDVDKTELLIVEGNSAGGTAKLARDRFFQAVLPMRGKMLNVEKAHYGRMLSSGEIGTLITVLGTGIGDEEFNIEKLRYNKIVLMTDADIDGAHIRTLLLTFFFRYMLPLIEAGHLYVLEPPLYKVTQGKTSMYLKDQAAADEFFMTQGLKKGSIHRQNKAVGDDDFLSDVIKRSYAMSEMLQSVSHIYDINILEQVLLCDVFQAENKSISVSESEKSRLLSRLDALVQEGDGTWSLDLSANGLLLHRKVRGVKEEFVLDESFYERSVCRDLLKIAEGLREFYAQRLMIRHGNNSHMISGVMDLIKNLHNIGHDGVTKQRYKGLGEMNAIQLWETTLDPKVRVLKQITIDDMEETERMFSILMGNEVSPRRKFIEENATQVSNLDI